MPVFFHKFDRYHINYLTPDNPDKEDLIVIYCSRELKNSDEMQPVGTLRFWKNVVPPNLYFGKQNIVLNYSLEDFPRILDILRNEKPCYLCMDPDTNYGYLATKYE